MLQLIQSLFFSNKIPSQKFKLEKESIKGVLLYVKNGDKAMRTWLINTEGENAFINYQFSLNTEIMTTNDIVDISKLGFSTPVVSATAFINFSSLPKTNLKPSALQIQLASKNMVFHNAKSSSQNGPAHHCDIVTCQSDGQGYCTAQESQQTG